MKPIHMKSWARNLLMLDLTFGPLLQGQTRGSLAKKKIMFLRSKNKASRKGYKGEC